MAARPLTLNDVVNNARNLDADLNLYRDRNADWFSSIIAGVDTIIARLADCDGALRAEEAAAARGEPVNDDILQEIQDIITRARVIVDASARDPEAQQFIEQIAARVRQLRKTAAYDPPNPMNDVQMNYLNDANLPADVPNRDRFGAVMPQVVNGGWRPTPKISRRVSARKTKTRTKSIKTKTKTKQKTKTKFRSKSR
jgi:hypothetical protein